MNRVFRIACFLTVIIIANISCVSPKKYSFNNQQKHNYIVSQKLNNEKLKELTKKWLKEKNINEKDINYQILSETDSSITISCEDRFHADDPGPNDYYYPIKFKMAIANFNNCTNIQFYEYMVLNFSKNSVINKPLEKKDKVSSYFNEFNNRLSNFIVSKSRYTNIDTSYYSKRYISVANGLTSKIEPSQCYTCRFYKRFEVSVNGGYSFLIQNNPTYNDFYTKYLNELKNGYNINTGVYYNFPIGFQLGFEYSYFNSKNYRPRVMLEIPNDTLYGVLSNNYNANYFGFAFGDRFSLRKDYYLNLHYGIGVLYFVDKAEVIEKYKQSQIKIVFNLGLSFEYFLTQQLGIGLGFTLSPVFLDNSKVKYENSNPKIQAYPFDDLSRIDYYLKFIYLLK